MPKTTKKVKPTRNQLEHLYELLTKKGYTKYIEWRSTDFRADFNHGYAILSFVMTADETRFKWLTCHYVMNNTTWFSRVRAFQFDKANSYPDEAYLNKAFEFFKQIDEELYEIYNRTNGLAAYVTKKVLEEPNG